jgi:thermitase
VAAAGNNGTNNSKLAFYPANSKHDNVISVAASTSTDHLASFSDYGSLVHLAAPGYKIYSTKNGNKYQTLSGTSMATPLISGVLATMIAARPDLSYKQIKGALLASVDSIPALTERVLWNGRVNAYEAMRLVTSIPADWQAPEPPAHVCP